VRKLLFSLFVLGLILSLCEGHGRLTLPIPRQKYTSGTTLRVDQQDAPNGLINPPYDASFVCRNTLPQPTKTALTAGTNVITQWNFQAAHVGDCAVYLSKDVTGKTDSQIEWYKVANFPKCRSNQNFDMPVAIPPWVQNCNNCIMRWEWYALQQYPSNVELYSQCVDVTISGGAANDPNPQPLIKIPGSRHLPLDIVNNYRDPFSGGTTVPLNHITGPAIATPSGTGTVPPAPTNPGKGDGITVPPDSGNSNANAVVTNPPSSAPSGAGAGVVVGVAVAVGLVSGLLGWFARGFSGKGQSGASWTAAGKV
jgi:hypothetical protein